MTHSRHAELKTMLDARRQALQEQVQQRLRALRDTASADTPRLATDLANDPMPGELDVALVEMQSQMLSHINAAIARLNEGDYGLCHDCTEEIPENRLRALPFAVRCRACQESEERVQMRDRRGDQRRMPFAASQGL
jgi:DnaK suppressor protein